MSRNSKITLVGKSGDEELLQQIMRENYYSGTDGTTFMFTEATPSAPGIWDKEDLVNTMIRIEALSSRAEMWLQTLRTVLGKQRVHRS